MVVEYIIVVIIIVSARMNIGGCLAVLRRFIAPAINIQTKRESWNILSEKWFNGCWEFGSSQEPANGKWVWKQSTLPHISKYWGDVIVYTPFTLPHPHRHIHSGYIHIYLYGKFIYYKMKINEALDQFGSFRMMWIEPY